MTQRRRGTKKEQWNLCVSASLRQILLPHQNCSLNPSCHFRICARLASEKIWPAVGESTCAFGWPRFTWLKALNISARNCPLNRSEISNRLLNDASTLKKCGPKNELRATFPKVPGA